MDVSVHWPLGPQITLDSSEKYEWVKIKGSREHHGHQHRDDITIHCAHKDWFAECRRLLEKHDESKE